MDVRRTSCALLWMCKGVLMAVGLPLGRAELMVLLRTVLSRRRTMPSFLAYRGVIEQIRVAVSYLPRMHVLTLDQL